MLKERSAKPAIIIHLFTQVLDTIHCANTAYTETRFEPDTGRVTMVS